MATEKITLGAILKITDVDTAGIEGKLEKLSKLGGSSLGFSSGQIDQARKLFDTIEGLSQASKKLGVNLAAQASGLNNILNRLDQANNLNLKVASVASQIDKLAVALGKGEISGKRFDQTIRNIFQNLGRPEGFKELVNDSLERAGKQLATKYNKELDALDKKVSQKSKQVVSQATVSNSKINEKRDEFVGFNARTELDSTKARAVERLRIERRAAEDIAAARTKAAEKQEEAAQNARRKAYDAAEKDRQKEIDAQKDAAFKAKRVLDEVTKPKASQFPNNKTEPTPAPLRSETDAYRKFQKEQEQDAAAAAQRAIDRRNAITQLTREANDREIASKQKLIALQEKLLTLANQAAKVNDASTAGGFRNLANKVAGTSSNDLTKRIDEITLGIVGNNDVSNRARKRVRSQAERQAINELLNGSGGAGGTGGGGLVGGGFGDFDKLNDQLKESRNNFNRAATSANNFGLAIGLAIRRFIAFQIGATALYTVIGVLRTGADEALKFEKQLTGIRQAVEGIDSDKLGKIIRSNAVSTGNSATEIATGVKLLSQAGFDQFEQLETFSDKLSKIPLVQNFEGIDQTVNGLIAIFGQFNKTAKDTGQILDIVNQYSKDFAVESKDIFAAVSRAGGSFALAGGTLEEFTQLFTVLRSETRESAETLGTFFKTGLNQLFRPQSQDLLKQLGVDTTRDFVSQFRELGKILQSSNLSGLEKLDIGRRLLDESRQFPRFLSLINALADDTKFKKLKEASQDAFGSFNRSASERLNDVGQSFNRIKVSLQDLVNSLVSDGSFKSLVRTVADLTQGLATLLKVVAPLTPLLLALATAKFSTKIGQTFKDFKSSFLEGIGGGERPGVVAIPQRGLGRVFNRRNIAGAGLAIAGGIATLGPALTESDSTAGRAISTGATFGLLGAAINPVVGALAALTAITISLSRSFSELEEKTLLNNALGAKTPTALQRSTSDLLQFGNNFNLSTIFSNSTRGELARARLSNGFFGGIAGAFTGRLPNEQGLAQNRFNILRDELTNREGAGAAIANLVQRQRDEILRKNPNINRDSLRQETFTALGGDNLNVIDKTILDRFIRLVFDKLGDGIKKALDSTVITDAFLQNANLNNLFNSLSDNLQPIADKLAKSFLQLDTVITNFSTTQKATLSGDNQRVLDSVFGSDNILSVLNKQTQSFAVEIGKVFSNPTIAEVFSKSNSDTEGLSARSLIRENSALKDVDVLSDKFAAIIDILAARSGQGADKVLSDLANSPNRAETIKQLSKNLQDAIESQVKSIREQVEVFNRELSVRQEINDRLLGLKDGIVSITSQIIDLAQQGGLRDLATDQFNNPNTPNFLNSIAEGNALRQQSQFSQFGDVGAFVDKLISAQEDAIRSNEELQRINRDGFNPNDRSQRDAFIKAEEDRKRLAEADRELASRTDELRNRLGKAAQATDLLRNAALEFKSSIDSAGQAVTQYTVRDLGDAIRAFRKFGFASGGFTNIRGGLNNITSDDFSKLTGLLGKLSSIPLGQGLTGSNLLGKINEDLGTRFAAIIRSQISGRSVDVEEASIRQELATMIAEANRAAQEEKALRTNLNALLGANIQSIEKEIFALDKQFIALDNISALLGPGNSLDTNVQNIYDLLKNAKILQNISDGINGKPAPVFNSLEDALTEISKPLPLPPRPPLPFEEPFSDPDFGTRRPPSSLQDELKGFKLLNSPSIPGPLGVALQAITASALGGLQPNNTRLSISDSERRDNGRRLAEQRENERLERIRAQIERKPYLLKQFSESDQQKLLSRYPELNKNANALGGANDKTAAKTDPNIVAITEGATKQLEVFNKAVSELSLLNQTSNVIKSILEEIKTGSGKTTATLEVAPMQVNVALSAPDILKLAGPQLAKNVIDAISPAISNAFGVVSEDARSVFNSGIGSV